jgi:hypothetical protein
MSPNYVLKKIETYESWAIPEFHSTQDPVRWQWLDRKLNQACYIRLKVRLKRSQRSLD